MPWLLGVFLVFGVLRASFDFPLHQGVTLVRAKKLFIPELCGYSGYFLLGWYLKNRVPALTRGRKWLCAALYLLAWAVIALGTRAYSLALGVNDERLYEYTHLPVFVEAVCLFLLFRGGRDTPLRGFISRAAPLTLGVYLLHPLLNHRVHELGFVLSLYASHPFLGVCAHTLCLFLLSAVPVLLLRRIRFVRRIL